MLLGVVSEVELFYLLVCKTIYARTDLKPVMINVNWDLPAFYLKIISLYALFLNVFIYFHENKSPLIWQTMTTIETVEDEKCIIPLIYFPVLIML